MIRAFFLIILTTLFLGQAPGETGGCMEESPVVNASLFCSEKEAWECRRKEQRKEIDSIEECVAYGIQYCEDKSWPKSCYPFPTERDADLCLNQLSLYSNLNKPIEEIDECDLCP